jgi:uncharacterized protein (DUF885 family)
MRLFLPSPQLSRTEAQRHPRFEIRRFHDLVLGGGRIPLTLLERRVRAGIAGWG